MTSERDSELGAAHSDAHSGDDDLVQDSQSVSNSVVAGIAPVQQGVLIINADDWGRDVATTNRIAECVRAGTVSSASAMVLMEDSERASEIARERHIDVGLHLNFTSPFSAGSIPGKVKEHHERVSRFLLQSRMAQVIYHPGLANSFEYVVSAQTDEFLRLYGQVPRRVDGHHHMHLCANVLFARLLPAGTIARRNFSFTQGEKGGINRLYRGMIDRILGMRHQLTDYFFSLPPLEPVERLKRIFALSQQYRVEMETHPINPAEYEFLMKDRIHFLSGESRISQGFQLGDRADLSRTANA